jgi:hypothetical protein
MMLFRAGQVIGNAGVLATADHAPFQRDVFVGCGVGEAGGSARNRTRRLRSDAIEEAQEPDRRIDRPVVDEPSHLLEDCRAFFVVKLDRLLLEYLVDVGVASAREFIEAPALCRLSISKAPL